PHSFDPLINFHGSSLFSYTYKLQISQLFCFDIHAKCRGCTPCGWISSNPKFVGRCLPAPCLFLTDVFYLCRAARLGSASVAPGLGGFFFISRDLPVTFSEESRIKWPQTTAEQITRIRRRPPSCPATSSVPTTRPSASTIFGSRCSAFFLGWPCRCSCASTWSGRECISRFSPASATRRIVTRPLPRCMARSWFFWCLPRRRRPASETIFFRCKSAHAKWLSPRSTSSPS